MITHDFRAPVSMLTITRGVTFQVYKVSHAFLRVQLSKTIFVILPPRNIPMELNPFWKIFGA